MTTLKLSPNASGAGSFTIAAPSTSSTLTLNLPSTLGTNNGSALVSTDASGNLGLGVTPSAWDATNVKALQLPAGSVWNYTTIQMNVGQNYYYNGTNYIYKNTAAASSFDQTGGAFYWKIAPSGTAGNAITFTQAMTLDASGRLMVGTTSQAGTLTIQDVVTDGSYSVGAAVKKSSTNTANYYVGPRFVVQNTSATANNFGSYAFQTANGNDYAAVWGICTSHTAGTGAGILAFGTSNNDGVAVERARIDSSGNLTIGSSTPLGGRLNVYGNIFVASMSTGAGTNALRYNTSNGLVSYDTSSARYKDNIRDSIYGLSHVLQMRSAQFEYKDTGRSDVGLIAEELDLIVPELVAKNAEGQPDAVSYDRMVSVLVKAIQEQQTLIQDQLAIINAQSAALEQLKAQLTSVSADVAALKGAK